jgi:hypothetical protein
LGVVSIFGFSAAAFAVTANTVISSQVSAVISMTSSGTVNINTIPSGGGAQTIASDTITVSTNDSSGYTLTLQENAASQNLVNGGNTIGPSTGTQTTPIAEAVNTWGYNVSGVGGFGTTCASSCAASSAAISATKFAAVPASGSPNTLVTTSGVATNATTAVWYGVAINTTVPSGTYTNTVLYTASAN